MAVCCKAWREDFVVATNVLLVAMAGRLGEIVEAVSRFTSAGSPTELGRLITSLRESQEPPFTAEQLDVAQAAVTALNAPVEERPSWPSLESRGLFFVFEGLDRSGKSTQSKLLAKHLETVPAHARTACVLPKARNVRRSVVTTRHSS